VDEGGTTLRTRFFRFALLSAGSIIIAPALAQAPAKPKPPPAQARMLVSASPLPSLEEATLARISAAMLSYTVLQVQGGWPTLPANARLLPGTRGEEVMTLRRRLVITEDLSHDRIDGDVYDEELGSASGCASSAPRSIVSR
jgi:hypothetical protein